MRTTLAIDDDVLAAAKGLARRQGKTVGEIVSALAREALRPAKTAAVRNGIPLLPARECAEPVTPELINELRDEGP